jgi:hypothetical protein
MPRRYAAVPFGKRLVALLCLNYDVGLKRWEQAHDQISTGVSRYYHEMAKIQLQKGPIIGAFLL